eukprot:4963814-Lingulodinium_polyedra.AAC.1
MLGAPGLHRKSRPLLSDGQWSTTRVERAPPRAAAQTPALWPSTRAASPSWADIRTATKACRGLAPR